MATEAKATSTASTVRRPGSSPAERQTALSKPPEHCTATEAQDKPIPNYLRPTASSCRSTGRQAPSPSAAPKSPAAKKPVVDRSQSSSSLLKDRSPKPSSPLPRPSVKPKINAKTPMLSKSKSFSKAGIDAAKKREGKKEERAAFLAAMLSKSSSFSRISTSGVRKKIEVKIKDPAELKKEEREEEEEDKTKVVEAETSAAKNERAVVLRRQESRGRESSQPYNEVIEETANKLAAAERRNKVKALVGAFETVISLQEPEGQQSQSPQKGETKVTSPLRGETYKVNALICDKTGEDSMISIVKSDKKEEDKREVNVLIYDRKKEDETKIDNEVRIEKIIKADEEEDKELGRREETNQVSQKYVQTDEKEDKNLNPQDKTSQESQRYVQEEKKAVMVEESQNQDSNEKVELISSTEEVNAREEESNATELTESAEEMKLAGSDDGHL